MKINYCSIDEVLESIELSILLSKQIGAMMKYLRLKIIETKLAAKTIKASNP